MTSEEIADLIRHERLKRGYSIHKLATKAGISINTLQGFEMKTRLNVGLELLQYVLEALGLSLEVVGGTDGKMDH